MAPNIVKVNPFKTLRNPRASVHITRMLAVLLVLLLTFWHGLRRGDFGFCLCFGFSFCFGFGLWLPLQSAPVRLIIFASCEMGCFVSPEDSTQSLPMNPKPQTLIILDPTPASSCVFGLGSGVVRQLSLGIVVHDIETALLLAIQSFPCLFIPAVIQHNRLDNGLLLSFPGKQFLNREISIP